MSSIVGAPINLQDASLCGGTHHDMIPP